METPVTKKQTPYWNFWKVVFVGWLVRYPGQVLKGIGTVVIGLFLFGVLVFSPSGEVEEPRDIGYNNQVPVRDRLVIQ